MLTNLMPKNAEKIICEICDFKCSKISNYNTHILTRKHKMLTNVDKFNAENAEKFTCECGKEYSHRQSLSLHKKKCIQKENVIEKEDIDNTSDKNLILTLIQQNNELQKQMLDVIKNGTHNTINNTSNSNNNLQLFLNETCKDAMNIMDFVDRQNSKKNS